MHAYPPCLQTEALSEQVNLLLACFSFLLKLCLSLFLHASMIAEACLTICASKLSGCADKK